jgi:cytochrome c-type biogenesis protein CcmH
VRRTGRIATAAACMTLAASSGVAAAAATRASLTDIEDEVMCVACHTPLAVSESPQANSERDYIRSLIAHGETKGQIKSALVAQYGQAVLALPSAHGFNLAVYILPPALVLAGVAMLVVTVPRWRRRARAAATRTGPAGAPLEPADERRLNEDLARYD